MPFVSGDRWTALEFDTATATPNERLLYTAHFAVPFDPAADQCGLLLDAWPELVPATDVMSGVALPVRPAELRDRRRRCCSRCRRADGALAWDDLVATITETLEDAGNRAPSNRRRSTDRLRAVPARDGDGGDALSDQIATNLAVNYRVFERIGSHERSGPKYVVADIQSALAERRFPPSRCGIVWRGGRGATTSTARSRPRFAIRCGC